MAIALNSGGTTDLWTVGTCGNYLSAENISGTSVTRGSLDFRNAGCLTVNGTGSYTIRSSSNGELISSDVYDYIAAVNNKSIEPIFRGCENTSVTTPTELSNLRGTLTSLTIPNNYTVTSGSLLVSTSDNTLRWNTDTGVLNTVVGVDGSITMGETDVRRAKRRKIKAGLTIITKSRANLLPKNVPANELIALETLHEELSETDFRKYLKFGFVLVKGKSGDTYQVFRNSWHTKVWRGGKLVEEICVRINNEAKVPPTDNVIAFKAIIETSEEEFKKLGNVYNMRKAA